jgi:hypothetical protein
MGRGELGTLLGAILVGVVGTPVLLVMANWVTNPIGALLLRLAIYAALPVIAARVAYATGFEAGRMSRGRTGQNAPTDGPYE